MPSSSYHALRTPDRLAVLYQDQRVTYAALYDRVQQAAAFLHRQGIGADAVVAVYMQNSAAFLELALAASYLGAVFLPLNYRLAPAEVAYILHHAEARLLCADAEYAPALAPLAGTAVPAMVSVDIAAQADSRRLCGSGAPPPPEQARRPQDVLRLMYTSGTTDRPKGVIHSYANFYWKCLDQVVALGLSAADRLLVVGPLYHVGALELPGLTVLWRGGLWCIQRAFDPAAALAAIQRERLTCAWFAPVMTNALLSFEGRAHYDVRSLQWAVGGGERTPESRIRAFTDLFPAARYVDGYGLTESLSGDTLMEAGRELDKIGSTGRALPHVELTIRDDAGRLLSPRVEGEIWLRGPKITRGYWRDPDTTRASFAEGWFRTGDVGYLDAEGFLYLTDRKKDMIISGGENIASSEVERVVYQLPAIREAAVIGVPDARWGERPVVVAAVHADTTLDYATLAAHCRAHLAGFKVPSALHLVEALPRNPSGKVLKRVLREQFAAREPADTRAPR